MITALGDGDLLLGDGEGEGDRRRTSGEGDLRGDGKGVITVTGRV